MKTRIYLDNNATTFLDPRVASAMTKFLQVHIGNPSSVHSYGREARSLLQKARREIAEYFNSKPQEVIFTSGGTEGANMLLRGACNLPKGHIISSSVEHPCVNSVLLEMQSAGWNITFIEPGLWGAVTAEAVRNAIRPDTRFITLMAANNETGVKTDITAVAQVALEANLPFIVDGVSLLGKELFSIPEGVTAMCFSGHKIHAPAGVGVCLIRSQFKFAPLLTGGEQEFQRRSGTENLLGIVALAEAIRVLKDEQAESVLRMQLLRDKLEKDVLSAIPTVTINGLGPRIANTTNIAFEGVEGESLLTLLDMEGIAVSHGSACSSGALEPSRVLLSMGLSRKTAASSLRISLSRFTTEKEVDVLVNAIVRIVSRLPR